MRRYNHKVGLVGLLVGVIILAIGFLTQGVGLRAGVGGLKLWGFASAAVAGGEVPGQREASHGTRALQSRDGLVVMDVVVRRRGAEDSTTAGGELVDSDGSDGSDGSGGSGEPGGRGRR